MDADKILLIVCLESVDDLSQICVGNVAERQVHVVGEKSSSTEGKIEPTVPSLSIERGEIVTVAIKLGVSKAARERAMLLRSR